MDIRAIQGWVSQVPFAQVKVTETLCETEPVVGVVENLPIDVVLGRDTLRLVEGPEDVLLTDYSQYGQSLVVARLLANKTGGFFVECGASDGENLSNTLYMERHLAWTGLLVEADHQRYTALVARRRHAYTVHTCLSPTRRAASMKFMYNGPYADGLSDYLGKAQGLTQGPGTLEVTLTCLPLYSILVAMGKSHVDYLSLDVDGPEVEILETIPWDRITINVLTVEYKYVDRGLTNSRRSMDKLRRVRRVVMSTGLYVDAGTVATLDVVFKRKHLIL